MSGFHLLFFLFLSLSPSLPPAVSLESQNIGETEKGYVHSQKKFNLPLFELYCTDSAIVFTDWSLFIVVVVVRYSAQRVYRGRHDWYHMKDGVVWGSEHRYHSGES